MLAPRSVLYGSASTTTQHVLAPPLRRSGRSGARGASIYLGREPDAATSASDGAADVNLSSSSSLYAQLCESGQSKQPIFFYWAILDATSGGDIAGEVVE